MATVVAFHAHPDDEALLTGGTLALLAAQGHRVVIVTGTDGAMGPATAPGAQTRLDELRASAAVLRAARVTTLGYADSGHGPLLYPDPPDRQRFASAELAEAAGRLADLLREEHADLLLSYDENGGYGHRDHVQVHRVGALAAQQAGVRILEATVPRELAWRVFNVFRRLRLAVRHNPAAIRAGFTPRAAITHRVNVRRQARSKQAAIAAHGSQVPGTGRSARLKRVLLAMPAPMFGLVLGIEWFAEPGAAGAPLKGDVLRPAAQRLGIDVTQVPQTNGNSASTRATPA
jgi:LmbE family N-acetylglucosaminyl deacetylase